MRSLLLAVLFSGCADKSRVCGHVVKAEFLGTAYLPNEQGEREALAEFRHL